MAAIKVQLKAIAQATISTAGTPIPLSLTERRCKAVIIQADPANSGAVYVGESDVTGAKAIKLTAGNSLSIVPDDTFADEDTVYVDLADIYVDAAANGEKINISVIDLASVNYNGG